MDEQETLEYQQLLSIYTKKLTADG